MALLELIIGKDRIDVTDLGQIVLEKGNHARREKGVCAMELASWLAGRGHTDSPPCVAPCVRKFIIGVNDRAPDGPRQRLKEILPDVLGSAERGDNQKRAYMLADWAARVVAPLACDAVGKKEEAKTLRDLPEIVDAASARNARDVARSVRAKINVVVAAYAAAAAAAYAAYAAAAAADADAAAAAAADAAYAAAAAARAKAREKMWGKLMDLAIPFIRKLAA